MKRVRIFISGVVTRVFFRAFIKENSDKLGINGYVRNVGDSIEAVFEGEEEKIKKMIDLCKNGPKAANVMKIEVEEAEYTGEFDSFCVRP